MLHCGVFVRNFLSTPSLTFKNVEKVDDDISGADKFGSKYSEGAKRKIIRPVSIKT